ncbi:hypothetical protein MBLNU457_g2554t3 [Dothideomycetes sp. NU457]
MSCHSVIRFWPFAITFATSLQYFTLQAHAQSVCDVGPVNQTTVYVQPVSINTDIVSNTTFYPIPQVAVTVTNAPTSFNGVTTYTWTTVSTENRVGSASNSTALTTATSGSVDNWPTSNSTTFSYASPAFSTTFQSSITESQSSTTVVQSSLTDSSIIGSVLSTTVSQSSLTDSSTTESQLSTTAVQYADAQRSGSLFSTASDPQSSSSVVVLSNTYSATSSAVSTTQPFISSTLTTTLSSADTTSFALVVSTQSSIDSSPIVETASQPPSVTSSTVTNAPSVSVSVSQTSSPSTYATRSTISATTTPALDTFMLMLTMPNRSHKRQSGTQYLGSNGTQTNDCTQAPIYTISNGSLSVTSGGQSYIYSATTGVAYEPFIASTVPGDITTTFQMSSSGTLSWFNNAFYNGQASFCQISNGTVYAVFSENGGPQGCMYIQLTLYTVSSCQTVQQITGPPGPQGSQARIHYLNMLKHSTNNE